jgi:hypothetical protein
MAHATAPARNDIYFGMVVLILVAQLVGIFALLLETTEYDSSKPAGTPQVSLPSALPIPDVGGPQGGGMLNVPPREVAEVPPAADAPVAAAKPAEAPAAPVVKADPPKPAAPVETPPAATPAKPTGNGSPTPSPLSLPRSFNPTPPTGR